VDNATTLTDTALSTAVCLAGAATHSTLKISPAEAPVFHRGMVLKVPIVANLQLLQQERQALIGKNSMRADRRRVSQ
jgi:hypothetical protein